MNVADSGLMTGILAEAGFVPTPEVTQADIILINTCAVRDKAEERIFARAQELAAQKKARKNVLLGITGCMAEHLKASLLARAPHVDIVIGPDAYRRLPDLIASAQGDQSSGRQPVIDVKLDKTETYENLAHANSEDGVSGFVSIQRGCDKFCTFCVVPFTRGRERGTPPRAILNQIRALVATGHREVVLLGQTVNSYRYEQVTFSQLLRTIADIPGVDRIRFTSPYPVDFTDELIDTIASVPEVCQHVHLPLQSGSDAVLKRMRRGYTIAEFRDIVTQLRTRAPQIAITTDILSGFCGETDGDHQKTLELMREIRFDSAFMFSYSQRDITYAAKNLPDDIDNATKKFRIRQIIELQQEISKQVFAAQVGKCERILLHSVSKRNPLELLGRTDGFKSVIVPKSTGQIGQFADVVIRRATMATLFGVKLERQSV